MKACHLLVYSLRHMISLFRCFCILLGFHDPGTTSAYRVLMSQHLEKITNYGSFEMLMA